MNDRNSQLAIPTAAGEAFAGGRYLGRFFASTAPYALIRAPKALGQFEPSPWNKNLKKVAGALSVYDGLANTQAMAEAGSKIAERALALQIDGFDDWYIPSRGEALLALAANADLPEGERHDEDWYWTSTQDADDPGFAWFQCFHDCGQYWNHKSDDRLVCVVRRHVIA